MAGADLVRKYIETFNGGDSTALGTFYAEDVLLIDPIAPQPVRGREAVAATSAVFRQVFPDLAWELTREPIVAHGAIAWEVRATGTMLGPMPGPEGEIPPTGKGFATAMGIFWTLGPDDLIAEERAYFDATGLMAQLGLSG